MADLCKQCSIELLGEDFGDLRNHNSRKLTSEEIAEGQGWYALCEGCGHTLVNDEGECLGNCMKGKKHDLCQ